MINGRMIALSGEELTAYLNSLSANDIKNIEVITHPSAKYDANNVGGLININIKKGALDTWKNSTQLSYQQNKYAAATIGNSFFYQKDKISLSANVNGTLGHEGAIQSLQTYYPNYTQDLQNESKREKHNLSSRLSMDVQMNENTLLGFQYLGIINQPGSKDYSRINYLDHSQKLDAYLINESVFNKKKTNHSFNIHWNQKLNKKGLTLSTNVDYFNYNQTANNSILGEMYDPNHEFLYTDISGNDESQQHIINYNLNADIEQPLSFLNLSYGAKASLTKSKSNRSFYDTQSGVEVLDNSQSNVFEYQENNQAIYGMASKKINNKIQGQIGLRIEFTQTKGLSKTIDQSINRSFVKLFPSLNFTFQATEENQFIINYGRKINRPPFWILNPFRNYINSNSYSEGNPFIQPSFVNNFELTHIYKNKLRSNLFYNRVTDGFGVIFKAESDTQIVTRDNYFSSHSFGLVENLTIDIKLWWNSSNTLALIGGKHSFKETINANPKNSILIYTASNHTFKLGKSSKLQVNLMGQNPFENGLYKMGYIFKMDIGFQQSFLDDKLQCSLLFSDIFNTGYLKDYTSSVNNVKQVYTENNSSRFVRLSLRYQFGNNKINVKSRRFGNAIERKRTK